MYSIVQILTSNQDKKSYGAPKLELVFPIVLGVFFGNGEVNFMAIVPFN